VDVAAEFVRPGAGPSPVGFYAECAGPGAEGRCVGGGRALEGGLRNVTAARHIVRSVGGGRIGEDRYPESGRGIVVRILHITDEISPEVAGVLYLRQHRLLFIVDALASAGVFPGPVERRKQHRRQNGDNGNHHKKFDQRESFSHLFFSCYS